jgi:hypothetical protein
MDTNDMIEKYFNILFINYFNEIEISSELMNNYSWSNILHIFNSLYEKLILFSNTSDFTKNYYLIMIYFLNYTNFLKYIKHKDYELNDVYVFLNKIKYNPDIIIFIQANIKNENIENIFGTFNPFIKKKLKLLGTTINKKLLMDFTENVKHLDDIYSDTNMTSKKILNVLLYRYILSNNVNESNYNNFFIKNIIEDNLSNIIDLDTMLKNLPNYKNIINLQVSSEIKNNLGIHLSSLVNFIIKDHSFIKMNTLIDSNKGKIIELTNEKFGGKIIIKKSVDKINKINLYQQNINLINFNIKELKNLHIFKKTNNFIVIEYTSSIINDLSTLLHLTHLITCGVKLLETYPSSIYECVYPLDYNKYYYKTFINFLSYVKEHVNKDMSYNRFLIDLIKYYYIYSYYDYYFYYNSNLVKTAIERIKYKNNIFSEFCESLKYLFKLPTEMTNYPPFFNIEDDLDNLIYYTLEIPNYFKFHDLISAIIQVFNVRVNNPNNVDLIKIILTIKCDNMNQIINGLYTQNNPLNTYNDINLTKNADNNKNSDKSKNADNNKKSDKSKEDNLSKIGINNIPKNEKNLVNNSNAFIELNIENSENYALNTEKN